MGCVYKKLGPKHASKDGIELAVFVAFGEVLSFGLGVVELILVPLLAVLLVSGLYFVHTVVYDVNKQAHNQDTENKDLSLSSNRKHMRYGAWSNIFGWFLNGTAEIILEIMWSNLGIFRGFLVHEMMG